MSVCQRGLRPSSESLVEEGRGLVEDGRAGELDQGR
jgi:hypothetical protein